MVLLRFLQINNSLDWFLSRPLPPEPTDDEDGLWELQEDDEVLEISKNFQVI
jgi:hypothetical protein